MGRAVFICFNFLIYRISNTRTRIFNLPFSINVPFYSIFFFFFLEKKLFSCSDIKGSSDMMFSSLSSRVIWFANFLFLGKIDCMFTEKVLLSVILLTSNVSKYIFEIPAHNFFRSHYRKCCFKKR